jgi:hypothetical protein
VGGLLAVLLVAGCRGATSPADPSKDPKGSSDLAAGKGKDGAAGADKKGVQEAACPYDENLSKYLPASTNRIEVMDLQAGRSSELLDFTLKGMLQRGNFGSWQHKEQGLGVLKQAGIAEDSVQSLTLAWLQGFKEPVVLMRFNKAPDQGQYVKALKATPAPADGKTCHEVRLLGATPLRYVHFLEPTLFAFSRDPKAIVQVAVARQPPAVSPELLAAIRLTRGGRPTAALAAKGGITGISPSVADFFWTFTRAPGSFFALSANARAIAYWYVPAERGFRAHFACMYPDEAAAAQAEAKATELIKQIRKAYETDRQTTVPELQAAAVRMFEQVNCARAGAVVTLSWPFDAEFVRHYWAPR